MASDHPDIISLTLDLECESFVQACRIAVHALKTHPDDTLSIVKWAVPASARQRKHGLHAVLDELAAGSQEPAQESLLLVLSNGSSADVFQPSGTDGWRFELGALTEDLSATARGEVIRGLIAVTRSLLEAGELRGARSDWIGAGAQCLPVPPIAGMRSQLNVTDETRVADAYDDSDAFWRGWDSSEAFGDCRLLLRAVSAVTGEQLLEQILDGQWAMARAARPSRTEFTLPQPTAAEHPIYRRGDRTMQMVGYHQDEQYIELACALQPGQHINGWEVFDLQAPLADGKLTDGRKLRSAHVVFLNKEAARQEKRPLLDIGARVFYQDAATGEDVELTD